MGNEFGSFITEVWLVLGQMSAYLLLGLLIAGIMSVSISPQLVEHFLGGRGLKPVVIASLFGIPLPLCSCSVLPVSASIRAHGGSRAAVTSFLLSTPQTGVDSIVVTYALLGPIFAIFRPLAALLTGILGGLFVYFAGEEEEETEKQESQSQQCDEPCCAKENGQNVFLRILKYAFLTLPRDIGPPMLLGVVIAGTLTAFVEPNALHAYLGSGIGAILILMVAGTPTYVCATASVPIAAGFIHMGASPGAALAFLISGPATNIATIPILWKVLGRRTAILYFLTVSISAVVCGLALDGLFPNLENSLPPLGTHVHDSDARSWIEHASAVILLILVALPFIFKEGRPQQNAET